MPTSKVTVHFSCPVERVWQVVTDLSNTAWRSDLAQAEVLDESHFVEHTKSGYATNFTVTAREPLRCWVFTMENGNMSGSWEGIFETAEGGTRLSEASAEAVPGRSAVGTAKIGTVSLRCLRQRAALPTMGGRKELSPDAQ